jgi:hypothetical protein
VLEQVPGYFVSTRVRGIRWGLEVVQLPGGIPELDSALPNVEMGDFSSHCEICVVGVGAGEELVVGLGCGL